MFLSLANDSIIPLLIPWVIPIIPSHHSIIRYIRGGKMKHDHGIILRKNF
jgi:hypothetical protein